MPSFDVVSEVELYEVRNAVDQANRELETRFDFRGVEASFALNDAVIELRAPEEFQLGQMRDILREKLTRRKVDPECLKPGDIEGAGKQKRQPFTLIQGIDTDQSRQIVKLVKGAKLKVQVAVQGEKVRVTGKKRDDLQQVIALLKDAELGLPLQFNNFRD
jgi:cyclic-di-GMP-binding protein